ncbi:tail fiber assembly protein [Achromobacter xylosoxidans]
MEKIVSQLNSEGFYVGPVIADASPLEPGVFLMPGGAVDAEPPEHLVAGKRYKLVVGRWMAEDMPRSDLPVQPESPGAEHLDLAARARRDVLLERATLRMAPLQDAVDLNIATEFERASLSAWKSYRVQLNRVPEQAHYPVTIDWPVEPA